MNLLGGLRGIPASNVCLLHGISVCGGAKPATAFSPGSLALWSSLSLFFCLLLQSKSPAQLPRLENEREKTKKDCYTHQSLSLCGSLHGCIGNSGGKAE